MPGDGLAGVVDGNDGDIEILRYTTSGEIPIFSDIVLIATSGYYLRLRRYSNCEFWDLLPNKRYKQSISGL